MSCRVTNKTMDELRQAIQEKMFPFERLVDQTQLETATMLSNVREKFVTVPIDNTVLKRGVPLDLSGKTSRYAYSDTLELAFSRRATDKAKMAFEKKMGKEKTTNISAQEDSIIKKETGTKIHNTLQDILEILIEEDSSELIHKNSIDKEYRQNLKTIEQIKESTGFSTNHFNALHSLASDIVKTISQQQKTINKTLNKPGKVKIYTEQFLFDPKKDLGSTADVIALYSDNTASIFDYKTMTPDKNTKIWNKVTKQYDVIDPNWIPNYKMDDWSLQIPEMKRILEEVFGVDTVRQARVVPIHVEHLLKPKADRKYGSALVPQLGQLQTAGDYLYQIPVVIEFTGKEDLDKAIQVLIQQKVNLNLKRERYGKSTDEYKAITARIQALTRDLQALTVKNDLGVLIKDYKGVVDKYSKAMGKLVDIDSKLTAEGETNPNYLNNEDLNDLLEELQALDVIVNSTSGYFEELEINNPELLKSILPHYESLSSKVGNMITNLKSKQIERTLNKEEIAQAKEAAPVTMWDKLFRTFSSIDHPVFKKAYNLVASANNKRRLATQTVEKQLRPLTTAVEEWARNNGKSSNKVYDDLIAEDGNLIRKLTKEFYTDRRTAQTKKDGVWLSKYLKQKSNATDIYNHNRQTYIERFKPTEAQLKNWEKTNSVFAMRNNEKYWYLYYEVNPEHETDYYSDQYKFINKKENKPLLDFYSYWTNAMKDNRKALGFGSDYESVPDNFIPWIKADLANQLLQGTLNFSGMKESVVDMFRTHSENDDTFGEVLETSKQRTNLVTGEVIHEVPKFFLNPIRGKDGQPDVARKSRDLSKSLLIFTSMANNYANMKEIEATTEALKTAIVEYGTTQETSTGKKVVNISGFLARYKGEQNELVQLYDKMIKYHVYGIKIQDEATQGKSLLLKAKRYQQLKELGLAIMTPIASYAATRVNRSLIGKSEFFYTKAQMKRAIKSASFANYLSEKTIGKDFNTKEAHALYLALVDFIEPTQGSTIDHKSKKLSASKAKKFLTSDTMFGLFRIGDEHIEGTVLNAMMQNYGISEDGNVRRLESLPEGTKSLLDGSKITDKGLVIDGILDVDGNINLERYTQFRKIVQGVVKQIKGSMNEEDMNAVNTTVIGNLMMSFRNWAPGLISARAEKLRWNPQTEAIHEGKFNTFLNELSKEDLGIMAYVGKVVLPKMVLLSSEMITFGAYKYKINETRTKQLFEQFKIKHKNNPEVQQMTFEDFKTYKQGQIRSLANELRIILIFTSMLAAYASMEDDEEKYYKQTWAGRKAFQLVNRIRRELSFFVNPEDWRTLITGTALPVSGVANDMFKWSKNSIDEITDFINGEDQENDKTPWLYYSLKFVPGNKAVKTLFEPFEEDKNADY